MVSVGFLELNSIAKGIEACDAMLKASEVKLVSARPSCPGKYNVIIQGDVAAVASAVAAGKYTGGNFVIDHVVIPRVHEQVVAAINCTTEIERVNAVGIMEFWDVASAVFGADAAVKAAEVTIMELRTGMGIGGKSFVVLTGDVAAVTEAVNCGAVYGEEAGMLLNKVVIPNPSIEIFEGLI